MNELNYLFGNKTAPKALMHLFKTKSTSAKEIANKFGIIVPLVERQLDKFSKSGVIISKKVEGAKVYSFNKKAVVYKSLTKMLKDSYAAIPEKEKEIFAIKRGRKAAIAPKKRGRKKKEA